MKGWRRGESGGQQDVVVLAQKREISKVRVRNLAVCAGQPSPGAMLIAQPDVARNHPSHRVKTHVCGQCIDG